MPSDKSMENLQRSGAGCVYVQRDQCNSTLRCVNCEASLGEYHSVACYAAAIARQKEERRD